jgi:hypothetical protein
VPSVWMTALLDPSRGSPCATLTPDRSRTGPRSGIPRHGVSVSGTVGAGAPPQRHLSSATPCSHPPLTELAPLSPRGKGYRITRTRIGKASQP